MARITVLGSVLGVALTLSGCHTLNKTAGRCDCDPPPVASLLQEPALPPHLCQGPNHFGHYAPAPPRMRPADEAPVMPAAPVVVPAPPVVTPPK